MFVLLLGLVLFLGVHSVRIVADDWRNAQVARSEARYKGLYSLASALGLALIVWGYGLTRSSPVDLWLPPQWTRHAASLLTLVSFVLLAAAYVPGTRIKAAVGHPMVAGVTVWAVAHLLSNGRLGDLVLFGAFLAWALLDYLAARRRDRAAGTVYRSAGLSRDAIAVVVGAVAWFVFALYLHGWLIGVRPFT
jgi:uncharacterized membrane protein